MSPIDVESYRKWWDYTRAYDEMLRRTDHEQAPWRIVPSDDKKRARINCISHILKTIPYASNSTNQISASARSDRPTI